MKWASVVWKLLWVRQSFAILASCMESSSSSSSAKPLNGVDFFLPYYFSEIRKGAKFLSTDNVYNKFCRKFLKVNFRRSPFSRETAVLGQDMWWPCFGFNFTHNEFTHVFTVMDDYDVTKVPFSSVRWVQPGCHLAKEQPQHVCIIYWTTPEQGENKLQKKILAGHILWNVWRPDR